MTDSVATGRTEAGTMEEETEEAAGTAHIAAESAMMKSVEKTDTADVTTAGKNLRLLLKNPEESAEASAKSIRKFPAPAESEGQTGMGIFDLFKKNSADTEQNDREQLYFLVMDVFTIKDRGTVVVGEFRDGTIRVGDDIVIRRTDGSRRRTSIAGIEKFKQGMIQSAVAGENVGILLKNITKSDVGRGDILER